MAVPPDDRAQSESLGTLLLVAVVTLSVGTFGVYYVASTTDGGAAGADNFDFEVAVTQDELRISHNGGPSVATADLQVIVENTSGEHTYPFDSGTIRGGGDDRFDPGEAWVLSWNQTVDTEITVSLIDDGSETLLLRETMTVSSTATDRPKLVARVTGTTATETATAAETATASETATATEIATATRAKDGVAGSVPVTEFGPRISNKRGLSADILILPTLTIES